MKKLSALVITTILFQSSNALACPTCIGSNENDKYYLWVIGAFILIIYFPMFYLFKTFFKWKSINNTELSKEI